MPRYRIDVSRFMKDGRFNAASSLQGGGKKGNRRRVQHAEDDMNFGFDEEQERLQWELMEDVADVPEDWGPGILLSLPLWDHQRAQDSLDAWDASEAAHEERVRDELDRHSPEPDA